MYKQHSKILSLKKLIKLYGYKIQNNNFSSFFANNFLYRFDDLNNYLIVYNFDKNTLFPTFHNYINSIQIPFESLEQVNQKLLKYGILSISTLSVAQRPKTKTLSNVEQSQQVYPNQKNYKLLG